MRTLISQRIQRIPEDRVSLYEPIEITNQSEALYAWTADGKRWLLKWKMQRKEILAEALGWLLSIRLKVPTPTGAITTHKGNPAWLSAFIEHTDYWDKSKMSAIHNIAEIGSMIALDAIIYNEDRHFKNILLEPDPTEYIMKAWSIDLAASEIGQPEAIHRIGLEIPRAVYLAEGIPLDAIRDGAQSTALLASKLDPKDLRDDVTEACGLVGEQKMDLLFHALLKRCQNASSLVEKYLTDYSEVIL